MKKFTPYLLSAAIAFLIMLVLSFFIEDQQQSRSTAIVGCILAVVILAAPIYNIDKWQLKVRTLVHTAVMAVAVIPLLMLSGWFEWHTIAGVQYMVASFAAFGFLAWLAGYLVSLYSGSKR